MGRDLWHSGSLPGLPLKMPPVSFFLPDVDKPAFDRLPEGEQLALYPKLFLSPSVNWTWRTFYHLSLSGFECSLVSELPSHGIIVCSASNLPLFFKPSAKQFIVSCVADLPPRFFAPCHVFQSASQARQFRTAGRFPLVEHMPHWPQPGLLPRLGHREDEFANVGFFGDVSSLAAELRAPEFSSQLAKLGLNFQTHFECFHDYRETDVVLAVRSLGGPVVANKPASKLINAWRAGTPAILGKENAFRELRRSSLDYLEADSVGECLLACERLKKDPDLRRAMIANGLERSAEFSEPALTQRWATFLGETLTPYVEEWSRLGWPRRRVFFAKQSLVRYGSSLARRARRLVASRRLPADRKSPL